VLQRKDIRALQWPDEYGSMVISPESPPRLLLLFPPGKLSLPTGISCQIPKKSALDILFPVIGSSLKMMVGVSVSIFQTIWPVCLTASLYVSLRLLTEDDEFAAPRVISERFSQLFLGNLSKPQ